MPKPYPLELRQRVVHTYLEGGVTMEQVAQRFCVAYLTVHRWVRRHHLNGHLRPEKATGGKSRLKVQPHHVQALCDWLKLEPHLTNQDLVERLIQEHQLSVSPPHISKLLKKAGYTRKKRHLKTTELLDQM